MTDRVGQHLGNYSLVRLLGRGGQAEVYLGEHRYLKSFAALKVVQASLDEMLREQFLAEAQTLARLVHPAIVRILDFTIEQDTPVLIMDYSPKGTMRQRYPRGTCLPLATVVSAVNQAASALHYAHSHHVIHRDVKPENLLLGPHDEVLLSDFGLSVFAPSPELLSTQAMAGTLPYMAPEQLQGHPCFASDQYSLAIVTYEWLTSRRPFTGSQWQLIQQQLYAAPPPLQEFNAAVPATVEAIVLRALHKDPRERYENVQAFAQALSHASQEVLYAREDAVGVAPLSEPLVVPQEESSTPSDQGTLPRPSVAQQAATWGTEMLLNDLPPLEKTWNSPQSLRPPRNSQRKKPPLTQERAIPILLTLACIFFLLASSTLAFVVLRKPSVVSVSTTTLVANPTVLRVGDVCVLTGTNFGPNNPIKFTYDGSQALIDEVGKRPLVARADEKGFFQVTVQIPAEWKPGGHSIYATDEAQRLSIETELTVQSPPATPPQLQLSTSTLDLGSGRAGAVSNKSLILKNGGGGQITWQAQSTDPWLTAAPNAGTFSGSQAITILVNRSSLVTQAYTGHISFVQYPDAPPLILTVTMIVTTASAALNISKGALAFSANQGQRTNPQTITLQNSGGQPLNWGSNVSTGDGNPWLSISPTSGHITPNASGLVTITVQPQLLQAGSYTATITFTGGASAQVSVALTIIPPGEPHVQGPTTVPEPIPTGA